MSTDPFADIAFQQEIGQPTYAELIYTEVRQGKAFPPATATVENSLVRLAYGKPGPYRDVEAQTPPKIVAVPPNPTRRRYTIGASGSTTPQLLKSQRIAAEFSKLIRNDIQQQSLEGFLRKQSSHVPTLAAPFDTVYEVVDLGTPVGLPVPYAGLVFKAGSPDRILVGGNGNAASGALYELDVARGVDGHITAVGTATRVIDAPNVDGGVAYHPSGVLFVCGWPSNVIHQYKPGSTTPDKTVNLSSLGVGNSVGSIGFVPVGYPGAGSTILIIWAAGTVYSATLTDDGLGTFNVTSAVSVGTVPGGPEGFVYVPLGSELFPNPSMMVTEYSAGQVSAYDLDINGRPDVGSRRIFLTGLDNAEGAAVDPQTGDYVFSTFGGDNRFFLIRGQGDGGFVPPETPIDPDVCPLPINGNFNTGIQNWTLAQPGGLVWDDVNGRVTVTGEGGYQAMTGLTPGKMMQFKFWYYWKLIDKPVGAPDNWIDGSWGFLFLLRADAPDGPIIGETFGYQLFDESGETFMNGGPVPNSGIVYIQLKTKPYILNGVSYEPNIQFDKICLVQQYDGTGGGGGGGTSGTCVTPITNVRTLLQWDGVPRQPVNIFNMLLRLTYRDPNNPLVRTTTDVLATTDGRLGTVTPVTCSNSNTCDFWKQNGDMGNPQSLITATGLNLATTNSITNGQFASVATKRNWLWAIPGSTAGTAQDAMISVWPDGEEGLLESIEILALMQAVNATGLTADEEELAFIGYSSTPGVQAMLPFTLTPGAGLMDGSPAVDAYEVVNPNSVQDFFFRTSPTPVATLDGEGVYYQLGSIDLQYAIPGTLQPPYDLLSVIALFIRSWFYSEPPSILTSAILQWQLFVNGQFVTSGEYSQGLSLSQVGDIKDFELRQDPSLGGSFNVTAPITSITLRVSSLFYSATPPVSGQVPQIDFVPPIIKIRGLAASSTQPVCAGPFQCDPDPAQNFDMVLRYTNGRGQAREFKTSFSRTSLYQTTASFPSSPTWDALSAIGGGVLGSTARWEGTKFVLDAVDGSGLDQCTAAIEFVANGRGKLNFTQKLGLDGRGSATAACDAKIEFTEVNKGVAINEVQSIVLPGPSGGHWTLQFNYAGQSGTTANIPWNASAAQVKSRLEALEVIGEGNVLVTGQGTPSVPFDVEFVGLLGGRDFRLMKADGTHLLGSSSGFVVKLLNGTLNERQTITKNSGINSDLLISFNNVQSIPIPFNATLNEMQAALEGISSIGSGNVSVTGNTTDRDADYQGPWYVDFVGGLAAQNVPALSVQTSGYSVVTNWQGGTGTNDLQKIQVSASAGSYTLTITKPDDNSIVVTTDPINANASATQVKSRMMQAANWLQDADLTVTKLPPVSGSPDLAQWTVEFKGDWASTSVPLMSVNGSNLQGASIVVQETTKGSGSSERQKMNLVNVQGGTYRLQVTIDGVTGETPLIPWDANAEGVELALQGLPLFPLADDVSVKDTEIRGQGVVASFLVTFNRRFGDVPLMTYTNNLQCSPLALADIGPPPYDYKLPSCEEDESIYCSPGPLLCRPGEGDDEQALEICCDPISIRDSANVYREVMLQRDLFDPNTVTKSGGAFTIRDMAVLKGLRPSQYNAYLRDFHTGVMRPVPITTEVDTKMSVILITADLDTKATRERIGRELKRRPNILPSRMSWSNPALQG